MNEKIELFKKKLMTTRKFNDEKIREFREYFKRKGKNE